MMANIKSKLVYSWKLIYRHLSSADVDGSGLVSLKQFKNELTLCATFLSTEELNYLQRHFGQGSSLNY